MTHWIGFYFNAFALFGMEFSSRIKGDVCGRSAYLYNAKELDRMHGLNWLDYGARWYDPTIGRWNAVDPLGEKYYNITSYAYCANNPLNAIDPNGGLVFFINGMHDDGTGGKPEYWGGFANKVMNQIQDWNAVYIDGSHGGIKSFPYNHSVKDRYDVGYENGKEYAKLFLFSYKNDDGSFKESIKVITHSMGAAYAKGFIESLINAGVPITMIEFEADFAPFQPTKQEAVKGVDTYQFSHKQDDVAKATLLGSPPGKIKGVSNSNYSNVDDEKKTHNISTFLDEIRKLPQGKYKVINGEIVRE